MKTFLRAIVLIAGLSAGSIFAHAESMTLHIPFAFVAGTKMLPAGDYVVAEPADRILMIRSGSSSAVMMVIPNSSGATKMGANFDSSGGMPVLSTISIDGTVYLISDSKSAVISKSVALARH